MSEISHKLKLLRRRENLSQQALAKLTGIAQGAIGDIESGRKQNLSGESLGKLCNHPQLRKYALWLITDTDSRVREPGVTYSVKDGRRLLHELPPAQRDQAIAFLQILGEQSAPD